MHTKVNKLFINLIKSEICGTPLQAELIQSITPEMLQELYSLASKHDQVHMAAVALKKHKLLGNDEIFKVFQRSLHVVLYRYETIAYELEQIYALFEAEKITFVPLKGAVIREYYPQPWMRTSGDIDILVRKEELDRAREVLVKKLGYTVVKNNYHDISMVSPGKTVLELHFQILENEECIDRLLEKVWDYVQPVEEGRYQSVMTPEYFVFHAFAHMLYHFLNGGCGVRYIIDIWMLEKKLAYDKEQLKSFCKLCGIECFSEYVHKLSRIWFEDEEFDSTSQCMEAYILEGGLFGSEESKVLARKTQTKSKLKYFLERIFVPYHEFCAMYPKVKKYPILYPYYTVKRWFKIFDKKIRDKALYEVKLNQEIGSDNVDALKGLFGQLRLGE